MSMYQRYSVLSFWLILSILCVSIQFYVMRCVLHSEPSKSKSENCQMLQTILFSSSRVRQPAPPHAVEIDLQDRMYHFQPKIVNQTTYKIRLANDRKVKVKYFCDECASMTQYSPDQVEFKFQLHATPFLLRIHCVDLERNEVIRIQHVEFAG